MPTINFNAHHAPLGAFATLTLGFRGARGGLGLELTGPANQNVFIGVEAQPDTFEVLPFWDGAEGGASELDAQANRYEVGGDEPIETHREHLRRVTLRPLGEAQMTRDFRVGTDTFASNDWEFTLFSPVPQAPDPDTASEDELRAAYVPAVWGEILVDNSAGDCERRAFIGWAGNDPYSGMRQFKGEGGLVGVGEGRHYAIVSLDEGVQAAQGFSPSDMLGETHEDAWTFGIGSCALLLAKVPPRSVRRFRVAFVFFREGLVTTGEPMRYFYTKLWRDIEDAAAYAIGRFDAARQAALEADAKIADAPLSGERAWMASHAIRSYLGSTELLLDASDRPVWVVNEGEYRMMNTFDLTVDHLFWEMEQNPWTVRNALDRFITRYSYEDRVRFPGSDEEHPGGLSFTHDMGIANVWSRPGYSVYERAHLHGCFSYMTGEQLVNWVLCASTYVFGTRDKAWRDANRSIFERCFQSLLNRDHFDPARRRGLIGGDSSRCQGGSEITTYDSLDVSLGQARGNVYLGGKIWAAYLGLERIFRALGDEERATQARVMATVAASTIVGAVSPDGTIPAVLEEGVEARIIPLIEGLAFPAYWKMEEALEAGGPFGEFVEALRTHLRGVLRVEQCAFGDGGWKLSSTSDNSWLSKIYLCQWVAQEVLGVRTDGDDDADRAHQAWLLDPRNAPQCWSDQMVAGHAQGSKYYPRGVTCALWMLQD